MKPIRVTIEDEVAARRIELERRRRQHKKPSRTVREMALERLKQIEDYGDVPLIPIRLQAA